VKTLLIVWHSRTGGAQAMAQAAANAASEITVRLLPAAETHPADILAADGYIFAAPENLAALSGPMKDLFDRCYYPVLDRIQGRSYAAMICAGSDGTGAVRQLTRITTGWRLRPIAEPLIICTHAQSPDAIAARKIIPAADLARCTELGAGFAAGLAEGIF
jgi:multimeric flavodoxin WrbA